MVNDTEISVTGHFLERIVNHHSLIVPFLSIGRMEISWIAACKKKENNFYITKGNTTSKQPLNQALSAKKHQSNCCNKSKANLHEENIVTTSNATLYQSNYGYKQNAKTNCSITLKQLLLQIKSNSLTKQLLLHHKKTKKLNTKTIIGKPQSKTAPKQLLLQHQNVTLH